jgi:4-diphosphocytidyl-2-C-methyl-D-erythritol kinase
MTLVLQAPAKLNLFLRIVGRRADGMHLLQTCFQFIDRCDEVALSVRRDGALIRRLGAAGVVAEQDLAMRAAHLLQQETGCPLGAEISVTKRIPLGGGLGGGSSDAAAVLVGLDRLWGLNEGKGLGRPRLAELGLKLGADVPVFIHGHAAWAEGIGQYLTPVDLPELWYLVLAPNAHVSSAEMYQVPELKRDSAPIRLRALLTRATGAEGADAMSNAFEPVVRARHPAVDEALRWLDRHAEARLTGSGACVFASFGSRADAERILARRPSGIDGFVARGLNRSPLHQGL